MHIEFKTKPRIVTTVTVELSLEEAEALYWAIEPRNSHARRFLPEGVLDAMTETSLEVEARLLGVLTDNGINPDRHIGEPESRVLKIA